MGELSIFVDESGDFGAYSHHSPYYIIALVFHDQTVDLTEHIRNFNHELMLLGLETDHCIHTGPIIRREKPYEHMNMQERKRIFNKMIGFTRHLDFTYTTFTIEKKQTHTTRDACEKLSKLLNRFVINNYHYFLSYEKIKIYYDNGQTQVTAILSSVLSQLFPHVEFRKVFPSDYRLFQVADLMCTLELTHLKLQAKTLSRSELAFWGSEGIFRKNYFKKAAAKKFPAVSAAERTV